MNHLDFSIIQLTTMREAILAIIDDGRLLPDGTRAPWGFYPASGVRDALRGLVDILGHTIDCPESTNQSAVLGYLTTTTQECSKPCKTAREALAKASDWHMDESGDVNEQRTQFCDAVQTYLVKEAQKANAEVVDLKARAF